MVFDAGPVGSSRYHRRTIQPDSGRFSLKENMERLARSNTMIRTLDNVTFRIHIIVWLERKLVAVLMLILSITGGNALS